MLIGYLDAGSGSLILQALLGGTAGITVAAKAWKNRRKPKADEPQADETERPTEAEEAPLSSGSNEA